MSYKILHRKWLLRPWMWGLMPLELAGLVAILTLFAIAQPDLYRTKLWEVGHQYGFNSNPRMILYAYANYEPFPSVPFVWSQTLTDFNVVISVMSLFFLTIKLIAFITKVWFPLLAVALNLAMVILYSVSVHGQMGPDYADERNPSSVAWYIAKSCDYALPFRAYKSCQLAKGTFAATVYMLVLYLANVAIALYVCWPNHGDKANGGSDGSPPVDIKEGQDWEMQHMKASASSRALPCTPRTQAFHALERGLPLRQQHG